MDALELRSHNLRLIWLPVGQEVSERLYARAGAEWIEIARSDPERAGLQSLIFSIVDAGQTREVVVRPLAWTAGPDQMVLQAEADGVPITITWRAIEGRVHQEVRAHFHWAVELESIRSRYLYSPAGRPYTAVAPLDLVFTPNLRPLEHDVIGDHRFHAPAVILQRGSLAFALLPDIEPLMTARSRRLKTSLNYDVLAGDYPIVEYGFLDWEQRDHVYYRHRPGTAVTTSNQELVYSIVLLAGAEEQHASFHRIVTRYYHHSRLLPALQARPEQQVRTFDEWERYTWYDYADRYWWEAEIAGWPVGNITSRREFVPGRLWHPTLPDGWFNHWFQSLRTALGMHHSGEQLADPLLVDRARRVLNLCLAAPQHEGAFPGVAYWDAGKQVLHWERDNTWAGLANWYHAFDMCWTAYWLLAWHEELVGSEPRILPRCRDLGDLLVRNMLPSGCIPSFYDADLTPNRRYLYDDNAETAGAAVLLFRLHELTGEGDYLHHALRAMAYIREQVVPANRWYDYETFFSCSPKPVDFRCPHTEQLPQNNLSIMQACLGFLLQHRITGDAIALADGERLLDYLSLFQQIWSPPWLTPDLLGGFATQNTDAEWSDARQCYAADLYLAYFERTGTREYLERGIAALRATFPVAPYENWAHRIEDVHGSWTGIHWGTGSAMASVVFARRRYGDLYIDAEAGWGAGIDACTVEDVVTDGDQLKLRVRVAGTADRSMTVVVRSDRRLRVSVNGRHQGECDPGRHALSIEVGSE